ncbi:MAG: hypothetical protein ABI068_07475 [Ktedonobacterales bacterium]
MSERTTANGQHAADEHDEQGSGQSGDLGDIRFDRHFRTPSSEGYYIIRNGERSAALDLHFTATTVHATLVLEHELERTLLARLIEQIDEDLVLSADTPRDDFVVNVYQGQEIGFYSDTFRADEEGVVLDGEGDDEDDFDGIIEE